MSASATAVRRAIDPDRCTAAVQEAVRIPSVFGDEAAISADLYMDVDQLRMLSARGSIPANGNAMSGRMLACTLALVLLIAIAVALAPLWGLALFFLAASPGLGAVVLSRGGMAQQDHRLPHQHARLGAAERERVDADIGRQGPQRHVERRCRIGIDLVHTLSCFEDGRAEERPGCNATILRTMLRSSP